MKGDFTRNSFSPKQGYTRVLMQQGRVQLDADWNEQIAILWDFWRSMVTDLVGPYAGPHGHCGFGIISPADFPLPEEFGLGAKEQQELRQMLQAGGDFLIGPGHYYVEGMPCRNGFGIFPYTNQPYLPQARAVAPNSYPNLVYLDVWERHVTPIEDSAIGEVALEGADTTARAKLVWQIKTLELREKINTPSAVREHWSTLVHEFQSRHRAYLRAMAKIPADVDDSEAPLSAPEALYRGPENQLYRVEIHHPGKVSSGVGGDQPTFKWSRDNGTVVFPIASIAGNVVTLAEMARDNRFALAPGDFVEIVDDDYVLWNRALPLLHVDNVDAQGTRIALQGAPATNVGQDPGKHPLLRRWDQKAGDPKKGGLELRDGAAVIREAHGDAGWMLLEDGVQIQFVKTEPESHFETGDYWLIPARTVTEDVIWPQSDGAPAALPPTGPEHYFAPLAIVKFNNKEILETVADCRLKIKTQVAF